jgi:hypothetical protein
MSFLRTYAIQAVALLLTLVLVRWIAIRANRPTPLVNGWYIVKWGPVLRWLSIAGCVMMLDAGVVLIPAVASDPIILTLVVFVVILPAYGALFFWRNWLKYKGDTLIVSNTWGGQKTFRLSDLQFTGSIGARGHAYIAATGTTVYVNSHQHGAKSLIQRLSRGAGGI